jgi:hypothetical protein
MIIKTLNAIARFKSIVVICAALLCACVAAAALFCVAPTPAYAAANGIYLATATPHYKHPQTGVIEDAGGDGSATLGQSMAESATYRQALVEVDQAGNTFVTIRLQLMDNIQNPTFSVDGTAVATTIMQEHYSTTSVQNTADYRMPVYSESSVIRCSMYVTAMGRNVIFYITLSGLTSGSGDFVTSVTVAAPAQSVQSSAGADAQSTAGAQAATATSVEGAASEQSVDGASSADEAEAAEDDSNVSTDAAEASSKSSSSSATTGLQEFDSRGNKVDSDDEGSEAAETAGVPVVVWVVGGVVVVAAIAAVVCVAYKKRKK